MTTLHPINPAMPNVMTLSEMQRAIESTLRKTKTALLAAQQDELPEPLIISDLRLEADNLHTALRVMWDRIEEKQREREPLTLGVCELLKTTGKVSLFEALPDVVNVNRFGVFTGAGELLDAFTDREEAELFYLDACDTARENVVFKDADGPIPFDLTLSGAAAIAAHVAA